MNYLLNKCNAYNKKLADNECNECSIKKHLKHIRNIDEFNIKISKNRRELVEFISIENMIRNSHVMYLNYLIKKL